MTPHHPPLPAILGPDRDLSVEATDDNQFAALKVVGEHSLDVMVVINEDGSVKYANPAALRIFGVTLEEAVGTVAFSYLHPDDADRVVRRFVGLLSKPKASDSDFVRATTPSGEVRELEIISTNFLDDPVVAGIVVNGRDVTEQRSTERGRAAAISDSEERFRLAFEDNMAPMIITDLNDRGIAVNRAFCQMLGYTREELLGNNSAPFTHPDDVGISEQTHERLLSGESADARYVKRYLHKDGRVVVVEASRSAARDAEGNALYFVISERDITDRVQRDHVLQLLSGVNRLALSANSEREFTQQVCELLVHEGGYALAWVGVSSLGEGGGVDVWCAAGDTGYLNGEMASWWGTPDSMTGHAGRAMRTGEIQVVDDLLAAAPTQTWRDRVDQFGFRSSVAIPDHFGTRRAALTVYSRSPFAFDAIATAGLEEIVREAEFAIAHVRSVHQTEAALIGATEAIAARSATESALTESEQRFRLAFEGNMAPMVFSDLEDRVIAVNDAFCRMVGFTREELMGHDAKQFTYTADIGITEGSHRRLRSGEVDQVRYVKRYQRKDGRVIVSEVSRSVARDASGRTLYFVASERDVTEERALTAQLSHQALHDPLTGLANRTLFDDRLAQAHARITRNGGMGAVLLLDLDDFKGVNDTYGHLTGDQLLSGIARRFEMVTRPADTLCRFGGDEFLYLAEGLASAQDVDDVAARLLEVLAEPFNINGLRLAQNATIGIVTWDDTTTDVSELVQQADVALFEAKSQGKGRFVVFTPDMHQEAVNRFTLVQELRQALATGEITMDYQPIVELATTRVVGFEALMRWRHPQRGLIPPNVFIPLAEQNELILELGVFALRAAVSAATQWISLDDSPAPYVTVNFSAHQFRDPGLVAMVDEVLATSGLAPERLVIEITESVTLLDITETLAVLGELSDRGVGVALDDFGTGYSSLSYLVRLHPRIIKIDRYFVSPSYDSAHNDTLLEAIVSLGNRLGVTMVAEGIETTQQYERLLDLNCDFGQGYLFAPAVPLHEATLMVGRRLGA